MTQLCPFLQVWWPWIPNRWSLLTEKTYSWVLTLTRLCMHGTTHNEYSHKCHMPVWYYSSQWCRRVVQYCIQWVGFESTCRSAHESIRMTQNLLQSYECGGCNANFQMGLVWYTSQGLWSHWSSQLQALPRTFVNRKDRCLVCTVLEQEALFVHSTCSYLHVLFLVVVWAWVYNPIAPIWAQRIPMHFYGGFTTRCCTLVHGLCFLTLYTRKLLKEAETMYYSITPSINSLLPNDAIWRHELWELSISLWEFTWGV